MIEGDATPAGTVVHVGDPGAVAPEGALSIPIERLWSQIGSVAKNQPATVVAGHGLRAAIAVGILERAGIEEVSFWWRKRSPAVAKKKRRSSFFRPFAE